MGVNVIETSANKYDDSEETFISGWADLAEFLTKKGFRISKNTLMTYHSKGYGPPVYARWGKRCMFLPSKAIAWARDRMYGHSATAAASMVAAQETAMDDDIPPL